MNEIELKFLISEADEARLLAHPVLAAALPGQTKVLNNRYFDTPDGLLNQRRVALRLRQQGNAWVQTVKCAGEALAGLSQRPEWEQAYRGHFDFSAIPAPLGPWLSELDAQGALQAVFETNFRRRALRVAVAGGEVELALDLGWVEAGERRERIAELELELLRSPTPDPVAEKAALLGSDASPAPSRSEGPLAPLFVLAEALAADLTLMPASRSKAERGYRLRVGQTLEATPHGLDSPVERLTPAALQTLFLAALEQIQANRPGVVQTEDCESLHQMRIGVRRLGALRKLFKPVLTPAAFSLLGQPLAGLRNGLGAVRNLDVVLSDVLSPERLAAEDAGALSRSAAYRALLTDLQQQRGDAFAELRKLLESPSLGLWSVQCLRQLQGEFLRPGDGEALPEIARQGLKKLAHPFHYWLRAAIDADPRALHQARVAGKHLRYALEYLPPKVPPKRLRSLGHFLKDFQEAAGRLNDLHVAGPLLLRAAGEDQERLAVVARFGDAHRQTYRRAQKRLRKARKALLKGA